MKRTLLALGGVLCVLAANAELPPAAVPSSSKSSAVETYRSHCTQVVTEQWMRRFDVTNAIGPASVKISFLVVPEGRATRIEVVTATQGAVTLRRTVLAAAEASRFTPIPPETVKELGNLPLKVSMEFALQTE